MTLALFEQAGAEDMALASGPMAAIQLRDAMRQRTFSAAFCVPESVRPVFVEPEIEWTHAATKSGAVISEKEM